MLYWAVKITIISIVLVILVHYLLNFFKSTLTVPKVKDLVNKPSQKYEDIYNIINNSNNTSNNNYNYNKNQENDYTLIDLLPTKEENNMKDELKNFLKSQLQNSNSNSNFDYNTNVSPLDSHNTENTSYSSY